jgi:hypothetical protein
VDEFLEAQYELARPGVRGWWDNLHITDEQAYALGQAAEDRRISHRAISVVLARWGYEVSPQQVGHWRRTRDR